VAGVKGFVSLAVIALGLAACTSSTAKSAKPPAQHYGDITVTSCGQDPNDNTSIVVNGTISSRHDTPYDYSFVIDSYNGAIPAGGTGVTENSVEPGAVLPWSAQITIAGGTSGTYTCRLRSILSTPSRS
jgi:hypothetical protein